MCAIDIQRGRGHGLPDYNTIRESLGLETISNWSDILGDNLADVDKLNQAYPDINNADPLMECTPNNTSAEVCWVNQCMHYFRTST